MADPHRRVPDGGRGQQPEAVPLPGGGVPQPVREEGTAGLVGDEAAGGGLCEGEGKAEACRQSIEAKYSSKVMDSTGGTSRMKTADVSKRNGHNYGRINLSSNSKIRTIAMQ